MKKPSHQQYRGPTAFIVTLSILLLCSGCTFPRIVILNDPLSAEEHLQAHRKEGKNKERSGTAF